ncbi:uncharacterized protein topaz1 isoform X2 [Betta splendens]|uniref:Protein TOPAZ1 n=1 Tax=Betta splendens TaxID=158456 RepID=A0A9W2Y4S1_BETSP|nr:uncharacterized protein topaz1 isoform X2 [Betta splendens]
MLPSSGGVRLNRVALQEIIRLKPFPRRRRVITDPSQQATEADSVQSGNKAGQGLLAEQVADADSNKEFCVAPSKRKRKRCYESRRDVKEEPTEDNSRPEGSLRRAVEATRCSFCGDCKCFLSQRWASGKRRGQSISPGLDPSAAKIKFWTENQFAEDSKKNVILINSSPKVTLCDVAQYCGTCSHSCGFLLTDILKTKVVHCFKQNMTSGFRFWPGCLGQDKCTSKDCASAKNAMFVPRVPSEENVCLSLSGHKRKIKDCPDAEMHDFGKGGTTEATARNYGEYRANMSERDGGEEKPGAEMHRNKRIRLKDNINGCLSTTSGLTDVNYETTTNSSLGKEQMCYWMSDSLPSLKPIFHSSSIFGSAATKTKHKKPCGQIGEVPETDAKQMLSEVFCEERAVLKDDPESFTCQRVRAYIRKINFSCARTYMPWPFSNRGSSLTADASSTTCPADSSPINQSSTLSSQTKAPAGPSLPSTNHAQPSKETRGENGECTLTQRTGKLRGCTFSYSPDTTQAEQPLHCHVSDTAGPSTPSQCGSELHTATFSASSTPVNEPETNSTTATPSPSAIALSDWELSSPFTRGGFSHPSATQSLFLLKKGTGVELADAHSTSASPLLPQFMPSPLEKLQTFQASSNFAQLSYSDSSQSCESSLILPQEEQEVDGNCFSGVNSSFGGLLKRAFESPVNYNAFTEHWLEANSDKFIIFPILSPISSPQRYSQTTSLPQSQGCSEGKEVNKDLSKHKVLPGYHVPHVRDDSSQSCNEDVDHQEQEVMSECTLSAPSSPRDVSNSNDEKSQDQTDLEEGEQGNSSSEQDLFNYKVKGTPSSTVLTEPHSPPNNKEDDGADFNNEVAGDGQPGVLDEFTAYEQDILLVDVIPDDSELFENLPEQSLLKLGPVRFNKVAKAARPGGLGKMSVHGASTEQKFSPVSVNFDWNNSEIAEEQERRPWRPQSSKTIVCLTTDKETHNTCQPDANNNGISSGLERTQPIQTVNSSHDIPPLMSVRNATSITNLSEFRRERSNPYCRRYFSESLSCGFKMCRFQHVPVDGDEKFCIETVIRFTKNSLCLQKAGAVFTGYYQNNSPGVYFSVPVLLSLLWALLKAGMVSDVLSVLSVSLAYRIVPSYEFLEALFNFVREKSLTDLMPELMELTAKMASSGLSLDDHCTKNTPELQHAVHPASPASVLSPSEPFPEYINLTQSVQEIELCGKQEDWRRMGELFTFLCKFSQHPNQVEQISGRIAVALLSESKDKLSLPFAAFADTGRIGVSLMLRYHKTHQWVKGRRVVEVLSMSKVNYSTMKSLFGNEDGASRCCLITKAAENFLRCGSVEGALNTLRENNWFLSSSSWPCEPADLESRSCVLLSLAEKTSHRDTLEVLHNLPGIKEATGLMDISRYSALFSSHLQVCVDRQILPVASDTVELMLSKKLPVDRGLLQILLHKLGKQKLWVRAREVFRHALSVGYYQGVSAPTGFMTLMVPCFLGEVELAFTFEMFIVVNATAILHNSDSPTASLNITLKRTQSSESEYLSAGSRLLSAACIPQPRLTVQYTAVNASQEQVFTLDICSARQWLRCNHLWANEVWMQ